MTNYVANAVTTLNHLAKLHGLQIKLGIRLVENS